MNEKEMYFSKYIVVEYNSKRPIHPFSHFHLDSLDKALALVEYLKSDVEYDERYSYAIYELKVIVEERK